MEPSCVLIVPRGDKAHYPVYDRFAEQLRASFAELGVDLPIVRRLIDVRGRPLVLGAHRVLGHRLYFLPTGSICFNLEHLEPRRSARLIRFLCRHQVWDFSPRNLEILRAAGHDDARLCEVGYHDTARRIPGCEETIDVLFFGNPRPSRRRAVLQSLRGLGLRVESLTAEFGRRLDDAISRARIVINIHRFDWHGMEMLRIGDLLANERFVVSERGTDPKLEERLAGGLVLCRYEDLVETCTRYLRKEDERRNIARKGAELMRRRSQAQLIRSALRTASPRPSEGAAVSAR